MLFKRIESYGEAIPHFERAIELSPQRGDVYYNLGNVYKALGNDELAEENFAKAIAVDPGLRALLHQPRHGAGGAGRFGDAIRIYQKGLQADLNQPRLHYNLGVVYERIGKLKEAREEYEAAVRPSRAGRTRSTTSASRSTAWATTGPPRRRCGDALRAEPEERPGAQQPRRGPGRPGRREEAAAGLPGVDEGRPALRAGGGQPRLAARGRTASSPRRWRSCERLLVLEPDNVDARLRLAAILRQLENYPEAIKQYSGRARRRSPTCPMRSKGLAAARRRRGREGEGADCYEQLEAPAARTRTSASTSRRS